MSEVTTATVMNIKIGLFASILAFLEYFGVPKEPFGLLGVLMFVDMITGITKQKAVNLYSDPKYFKPVTSTRFTFGIVKKLIILLTICSVAIAIKALGYNPNVLLTLAITGFIASETYSIVQNGYIINTGKFLPEFDATGIVLKAIMVFIKNRFTVAVEKIEENEKEKEKQYQKESSSV